MTELDPSANKLVNNHQDGKDLAAHFKNPIFGSKLFSKVTKNQ